MLLYNGKAFSLKLLKSGAFYLKPVVCPHRESLTRVKWESGSTYVGKHYGIPTTLDFFWFKLLLRLTLVKEPLSDQKYVLFEDTHFALIENEQ